jgi:hypothetical protein
MEKIDRLKQLLLTHRTEDISKLTFEQRMNFDDVFAQEIVKLFAIPVVIEPKGKLKCECKDEWMEDVIYMQCSKCGEKY